MEQIEKVGSDFCAISSPEPQCLYSEKQHFLNMTYNDNNLDSLFMKRLSDKFKKPRDDTLDNVISSLWTIMPVVFFFAIARIVCQQLEKKISINFLSKFLIEFIIIVVPTVLFVNVLNEYVIFVMILFVFYVSMTLYSNYKAQTCQTCWYDLGGNRPYVLTIVRAIINLLTVLCILAVDFICFPKKFRKTRGYGAGLMDVGIGLFVFAMGAVSQPPTKMSDCKRLTCTVLPLLVLGMLRTVILSHINYSQDEHEYGQHMNAFFTLGLTKLIGFVLSGLVVSGPAHVVLGVVIAFIHEYSLQFSIANFVMNPEIVRDTLLRANREGFFSLPGFVSIYLISVCIGQTLRVSDGLVSQNVLFGKLKSLFIAVIGLWVIVITCIHTISIARVTCNLGYITWILAITLTMLFISMIVFHLVLNVTCINMDKKMLLESHKSIESFVTTHISSNVVPTLAEAVNKNGLTFFLLANLLTGGVNIFLEPSERYDNESIFILTMYMLISIGVVQLLYRFNIRIA